MPRKEVSDETRRAVVLAALAGESPTEIARRHEVTRQYVYRQAKKARDPEERAFWRAVERLIS